MRQGRSSFTRTAARAAIAAVLTISCFDHSGPADGLIGRLAIRPVLGAASPVPLAEARLVLTRNPGGEPAGVTVVDLAPTDTTVEFSFTVEMRSQDETFLLTIQLITPEGDTAYRAGPVVVSPSTGAEPTPIDVAFRFEGTSEIWSTGGDGTEIATIDTETGAATTIGRQGFTQGWAAAFDTDGTLYTLVNGFSGNSVLGTVNQSTGAVTLIGQGVGTSMISLEFDAAGTLYGIGYSDGLLYRIDKTLGTALPIGDGTGISLNMDLAYNSAGTLYATVGNNLWTINTTNGVATSVGPISGVCPGGEIMGIMFDLNDVLYATNYAAAAASCLMIVDLTTLTATTVGLTGLNLPHGGDILR